MCDLYLGISKTSSCLLKRQIETVKNPLMRKKYDEELRAFAITLHFLSPKAYDYVRDTFDTCLPAPKTLCRWYQTVDGRPGFSSEALYAVKTRSASIEGHW